MGQQRSWPVDHEAESFVYMTGLFIRLAIQSNNYLFFKRENNRSE
jgi:hypothetical protein